MQESPTKESVLLCYHGFKDRSQSPTIDDRKTLQLLHLLGGIDYVLEQFLCNDDIQITQIQLNHLNQMFITSHTIVKNNKLQTLSQIHHGSNSTETHNIHNKMRHELDVSNTYLQSIFGETVAVNVTNIITSKYVLIPLVLLVTVFSVLRFIIPDNITFLIFILILSTIIHCWLIMWLLSANKTAVRLVIRTFEFWLKFVSAIVFISLRFITTYVYGATSIGTRGHELRMITDVIVMMDILLGVVILSLFDALHISRVPKICFSLMFIFAATVTVIYQNYLYYFNGEESVVSVTDNVSVSLISIQINALEVLLLFYLKQVILTICRKDQCVLIKYSPYIEWIDSNQTHTEMDSEITNNYVSYDQHESDDEKAIATCTPITKEVVANSEPGFQMEQDNNEHSNTVLSNLFHEAVELIDEDDAICASSSTGDDHDPF
eukprot:1041494_1